jgi:site-specific DNA-cytosine methylase
VLKRIAETRPRAVVLENVVVLVSRFALEFYDNLRILLSLDYRVSWDILDATDHGLSQSRPRLYIVAIRVDSCVTTFRFPRALTFMPAVQKFLDQWLSGKQRHTFAHATAAKNFHQAKRRMEVKGVDLDKQTVFVDVMASASFSTHRLDCCPCITATRGSQGGFYVTSQKRMTSVEEMARLQGFPTKYAKALLEAGSKPQVGHAIGNAMSVNTLTRLLPKVLVAAGLVRPGEIVDPWKHITQAFVKQSKLLPDDLYRGASTPSAKCRKLEGSSMPSAKRSKLEG